MEVGDVAGAESPASSSKEFDLIKRSKLEVRPNLVHRKGRSKSGECERRGEVKIPLKKLKADGSVNQTQQEPKDKTAFNEDVYKGKGNRFNILAEETVEDKEMSNDILRRIAEKNMKISPININESSRKTQNDVHTQKEAGKDSERRQIKEKIPPIVIFNQQIEDTMKICKVVLRLKNFRIKRYSSNRHSIFLDNKSDYNKAKETLKSVATEHYSYCPRSEKVQTMLLKGIDPESDVNEILSELQNLNVENVKFLSVKRFETKLSKEKSNKLPIFLVQMSSDSQVEKLRSVRYVNYQVVRWEKITKKEIIQCKRCQRFGHTASNCAMKYRCVKCADDHEPGQCSIKPDSPINKEKIFCTLCKNFGHPAPYRGCTKYLELKEKLVQKKEALKINSEHKLKMYSNFVNKNISFANVASNVSNNLGIQAGNQNPSQNSGQNLMGEIKSMLVNIQNQLSTFKIMLEEEKSRIDILYDLIGSGGMDG